MVKLLLEERAYWDVCFLDSEYFDVAVILICIWSWRAMDNRIRYVHWSWTKLFNFSLFLEGVMVNKLTIINLPYFFFRHDLFSYKQKFVNNPYNLLFNLGVFLGDRYSLKWSRPPIPLNIYLSSIEQWEFENLFIRGKKKGSRYENN